MKNVDIDGFYYDPTYYINEGVDIASQYLMHVLNHYPSILNDKARVFCPAMRLCESHDMIEYVAFDYNPMTVVVKLNGKNKTLTYFDNEDDYNEWGATWMDDDYCEKANIIQLLDNSNGVSEINDIIYNVMISKNILDRPLLITGYMCVSCGATLTNEKLGNFSSAIFSPHLGSIKNKDNIYQIIGRTSSRSLKWSTHSSTKIYCIDKIYKIACSLEKAALYNHNMPILTTKIVNEKEYTEYLL